MIEMHEDDRKYQFIIWREDPTKPLGYYALNTLTYGTASASHLSARTILQIGIDYKDKYNCMALLMPVRRLMAHAVTYDQ